MLTDARATVAGGRAVVAAAQQLRADLDAGKTLADLAGRRYLGEFVYDKTSKLGAPVENPITHLSFGYATQLAILADKGRLAKLVASHDVGRVINPVLLAGQGVGSVHIGVAVALSGELLVGAGALDNS